MTLSILSENQDLPNKQASNCAVSPATSPDAASFAATRQQERSCAQPVERRFPFRLEVLRVHKRGLDLQISSEYPDLSVSFSAVSKPRAYEQDSDIFITFSWRRLHIHCAGKKYLIDYRALRSAYRAMCRAALEAQAEQVREAA